jgi:membrane-associated phospholipid phosphatase
MKAKILKPIQKLDRKVNRNASSDGFHFPEAVDKAFKWAPLASLLLLDALGVKTKNDFKQHLLIIGIGGALLDAVVKPVKHKVDRMRPNHSLKMNSLPSSHTATSFLGAEALHQELKDTNKPLAYSGYAVAAVTGALRIYNKKHWLSDVLAGAVLGFVSAKIAYDVLKKL